MKSRFPIHALAGAAACAMASAASAQQSPAPAEAQNDDAIVVTATARSTQMLDVPIAMTAISGEELERSGVRTIQDVARLVPSFQFQTGDSQVNASARIRGVGTNGSNPGLESAVGVFVDGVYRARNGISFTDLGELEQIEVLRGPQGTLFGRNTSAGLIVVRTRAPSLDEARGSVELTAGSFDQRRAAANLSVPIVPDELAGSISVVRDLQDGTVRILDRDGRKRAPSNDRDVWALRAQLAGQLGDNAEFRLIADYGRRDEICCAAQVYSPADYNGGNAGFPGAAAGVIAALGGYGPDGLAALGDGSLDRRTAFADHDAHQKVKDRGLSLQVDWQLGGVELTSISAYRNWDAGIGQDSDFSAADIFHRDGTGPDGSGYGVSIFTQELRLAGEIGILDWVAGGFFSAETLDRTDAPTLGSQYGRYFQLLTQATGIAGVVDNLAAMPGLTGAGTLDRHRQKTRSYSIFTHNIVTLTDRLELTLGGRFTAEDKSLRSTFSTRASGLDAFAAGLAEINPGLAAFANCNPASLPGGAANALIIGARSVYCVPWLRSELDGTYRQKRQEREFSGVASLRYAPSPNFSAYATYSQGYKAGGFNLDRNFAGVAYTGASSTVASRSLDTSFDPETVDMGEIGIKTRTAGGALSVNLAAYYSRFSGFQLNTFNGIAFTVTSLPKVISKGFDVDVTWRTPLDGLRLTGALAYNDASYGSDTGWVDAARNPLNPAEPSPLARLPNNHLTVAPKWTLATGASYETEIGAGLLLQLQANARYTSRFSASSDLNPLKDTPAFWLVDGRIALATDDERYSLEFWVRNLLDHDYTMAAFNTPLQSGSYTAFLAEPRSLGGTFRARF